MTLESNGEDLKTSSRSFALSVAFPKSQRQTLPSVHQMVHFLSISLFSDAPKSPLSSCLEIVR